MGETVGSQPQHVNGLFRVGTTATRTITAQAAAYQCNESLQATRQQRLKPLKNGAFASWHSLCNVKPRRLITTWPSTWSGQVSRQSGTRTKASSPG